LKIQENLFQFEAGFFILQIFLMLNFEILFGQSKKCSQVCTIKNK